MVAKSKGAGVDVLLMSKVLLEEFCMMPSVKPRLWIRSERRREWLLRLAQVPRPKPGAAAEGCTVSWKPCFLSMKRSLTTLFASVMRETG